MKRRDLIKEMESLGYRLERHGHDHDIYTNGKRSEPVSRQTEIDDVLAKKILKRCREK